MSADKFIWIEDNLAINSVCVLQKLLGDTHSAGWNKKDILSIYPPECREVSNFRNNLSMDSRVHDLSNKYSFTFSESSVVDQIMEDPWPTWACDLRVHDSHFFLLGWKFGNCNHTRIRRGPKKKKKINRKIKREKLRYKKLENCTICSVVFNVKCNSFLVPCTFSKYRPSCSLWIFQVIKIIGRGEQKDTFQIWNMNSIRKLGI